MINLHSSLDSLHQMHLAGSIRKDLIDRCSNGWLVRYSIINNIYNNNLYFNTTAMDGTYMETQLLVQSSSSPASIVVVTTTSHWHFGELQQIFNTGYQQWLSQLKIIMVMLAFLNMSTQPTNIQQPINHQYIAHLLCLCLLN